MRLILCVTIFFSFTLSAQTLRVAVSSNFHLTLKSLASDFSKRTGVELLLSPASSGILYSQIIHGAPFDIFMSADTERITQLQLQGKLHEKSRLKYAQGQLVLWSSDPKVKAPMFSFNHHTRFAIANPKFAPYGKSAYAWLIKQGAAKQSQGSKNLIFGNNVAQTFQFIDTGNVKVGLIPLSLIKYAQRKFTTDSKYHNFYLLPIDTYPAIYQEMAILKSTKYLDLAKQFYTFIQSNAAKQTIREFGYLTDF